MRPVSLISLSGRCLALAEREEIAILDASRCGVRRSAAGGDVVPRRFGQCLFMHRGIACVEPTLLGDFRAYWPCEFPRFHPLASLSRILSKLPGMCRRVLHRYSGPVG
jgi:hypothetical protein